MTEWNFDPPPDITDRDTGLVAVLKKLRYDLTAAQGKLSEALRMVADLDLGEHNERTPFINGPVTAPSCPECGTGAGLHADWCEALEPLVARAHALPGEAGDDA